MSNKAVSLPLYERYIQEVVGGEKVVGELVRKAVKRFQRMRDRADIVFDPKEVESVIQFFRLLKHFKGAHAGKPFILADWQEFAIAAIFGLFYRETGDRVTRNVYIEIARKNGKTAFGSGLSLYLLMADGERGAEVDLAANSKEQAKIAFNFASTFARVFNSNSKMVKIMRDKLIFERTDSFLHVFATDTASLDGYDASAYLLDEYHAAPNSALRDVLQSSQASRRNPLGIIITTAGFNLNSACYQYRTSCIEVLNGLSANDSLFPLIFSLDGGDDWRDPTVWVKCAPNFGVTVNERFYEEAVKQVEQDPTAENSIKTKTFNMWVGSDEVWIPERHVQESSRVIEINEIVNRATDLCYGGIDLASTSDLNAVGLLCNKAKDDKLYLWVKYYLPEESCNSKRDRLQYEEWARRGFLTLTPGNVTDYNYILKDLKELDQVMFFQSIGYDNYNATQFVISAEEMGLPMRPFSQSIGNFNIPTKEFERLLKSGRLVIDNNPITRFCLRNVKLRMDANGNVKPDKSKSKDKIDGVIAMVQAIGVYLKDPQSDIGL